MIEKPSNVPRTLSPTILIHESDAIESESSEIVSRTKSDGLDFPSTCFALRTDLRPEHIELPCASFDRRR